MLSEIEINYVRLALFLFYFLKHVIARAQVVSIYNIVERLNGFLQISMEVNTIESGTERGKQVKRKRRRKVET